MNLIYVVHPYLRSLFLVFFCAGGYIGGFRPDFASAWLFMYTCATSGVV